MDMSVFKKLESGPLPKVLLVHGPEQYWQDFVYRKLQERNSQDSFAEWNWSVFYGEKEFDLEALRVELGQIAWGGGSKIVVLKNSQDVPANAMEQLANWLAQLETSNCLALFFAKVDNRWRYLKTLRQYALEINCAPMERDALVRYVEDYCLVEGKKMSKSTVELFLSRTGSDLQVVHNELEKLLAFAAEYEEITPGHVRSITALWPEQIEKHTIFQMTDMIVEKKRDQALAVLNQLLAAGEPALRILPVIERQLRLVLAAKTSTTSIEKTAEQMGESSSFALKKVRSQARQMELDEIFAGFAAVVQADRELKLGAPGEQVLTDLIVKLT